jgi:hypothetical protein
MPGRSVPIDVTIRALRVRSPTIKCYSPSAERALTLALGIARKDNLLPPGTQVVSVEFAGTPVGDPITGEAIVGIVERSGFSWRGR